MDNLTISVRYSPRPAHQRCDPPGWQYGYDPIPWTGDLTVNGDRKGSLRGSSASYILEILTKASEKYHA